MLLKIEELSKGTYAEADSYDRFELFMLAESNDDSFMNF